MTRIVAYMACAITIALTVACSIDPSDERPGLGLSGEVHQQGVEDWSFTSDADEIFIETVTSYWIPHSVTAWCVTVGNGVSVVERARTKATQAGDSDPGTWGSSSAPQPAGVVRGASPPWSVATISSSPTQITCTDVGPPLPRPAVATRDERFQVPSRGTIAEC